MTPEAQSQIKNLLQELRVDSETKIHWITKSLSDFAEAFPFVGILAGLMLLDIATGIVAAIIKGEVNSSCSFRGAFKKVQMLLLVAAGLTFEFLYPEVPWGRMIAALFSLGEMISIIENAGRAGVPIPDQLRETLSRLKSTQAEAPTVRIEVTQDRVEKHESSDDSVVVVDSQIKKAAQGSGP